MFTTKLALIQEQLRQRCEEVINFRPSHEGIVIHVTGDERTPEQAFQDVIAHFVYFIHKTPELKSHFEELLYYANRMAQSEQVKNINEECAFQLRKIAQRIMGAPTFPAFSSNYKSSFVDRRNEFPYRFNDANTWLNQLMKYTPQGAQIPALRTICDKLVEVVIEFSKDDAAFAEELTGPVEDKVYPIVWTKKQSI